VHAALRAAFDVSEVAPNAVRGRHATDMTTLIFLLKRFVAQRLLGVAIVVTLGFTIGVLVAGPIYADAAREAILQSEVATANVTVKNVRFTQYGDPAFAYHQADSELTRAVGSLPLASLIRQGRGTVRLAVGNQDPVSITVLFRSGATAHVPYHGEPPTAADEVALPSSIARVLRVGTGDRVTLLGPGGQGTSMTVVGTFDRPGAREADYWYGTQTPFPSETRQPGQLGVAAQIPPALMSEEGYLASIPSLGVTTEYVWDAYVRYRDLTFAQAQRLPGLIGTADRTLRDDDDAFAALRTTTGIDTMIRLVGQRVDDLRVPIFLVVFQIGAVTLAVLAGVGALVLSRQSFELAVLRSRGFSGRTLIAAQAVQATLSAVVAFPVGLLLGAALARLASRSNGPSLPGVLFPIHLSAPAEVLGVVGAVVGALALLLLSLPHVRRTILEERRLLSREDRPLLARVPVELFVLPVAIFAFVQLRGTEVQGNAARADLDPLVLLTPTLLIFAASFLALRVLLLALRRLDGVVGRSRRLSLYLAARRLGRSPGTSFATSLLLVLSVGLLVVSTSYRAIVLRNHEDSAHQQVGSDWNIQVAAPDQPLAALRRAPSNTTGVIRTEPSFERTGNFSLTPTVLAVDPATYAEAGWWRSDYSPTAEDDWIAALEAADPSVRVAGDAFSATVTADRAASGLELLVTYEAAGGDVRTADAGALAAGTAEVSVDTPGATRVMSIGFAEPSAGSLERSAGLRIVGARVGETPLALEGWEPLTWRGSGGVIRPTGGGVNVSITPGAGSVVGLIAPPSPPIPALVSPEVARSQGQDFHATLGGQRLAFHGVAIAEHFPSIAGDFVVVSTPALLRAAERIPEPGLALNEIWASGPTDPRRALARVGFVPGAVRSVAPIVGALAQLPQSLAVGMNYATAAGGLGLVVIGVGVGLYFAQRRREFEFASLRAMGAEPRQIRRVLLLEQGTMIVFAIVVGLGLGYGTLKLVMPYVGRSIGSAFPPPVLTLDRVSLGIALVAIVIATAVGLLAALNALVRSSVTSVLRGEAE
jgi:ABC-type lipoprotein release transport system permease subunit